MEQQDRVYRQQIEYFLNKMDYPPEHLQGYQILQGGNLWRGNLPIADDRGRICL